MQNVGQSENRNIDKVNVQLDVVKSSNPHSSASSPAKSETETYSGAPAKYMTDSSESEDDSVSEAEMDEENGGADTSKFLSSHDDPERAVDPEMQARLEALLEAAGIGKLSGEGKHLADPEVLRRLTSSVSCALDEAAAALTRMRSDQPPQHHRHHHHDKPTQCGSSATAAPTVASSVGADGAPSLAEACSDGDVGTVRKLLTEGRSVHETTEEGESLLSLACSAGYYELAQVLLAMKASVEDRGIKGDCTPLMEAASAGHADIVRLLLANEADVNAVSGSGNTPLMYACAGGHEECVRVLLEHGANVEDHNENGHTPLMEAASAGHVGVAKILLEHGAGINTHSNEFKESALTLACYKGHLDMVRFLLAAGADREHKTDEMHTALMEASMDGHVEVAKLLLDSGAQVNMPTDSFESPLTLAACGGHVKLAMLLLERGANIEEVNDEGYTPLMEAAREGHEEMVSLLLAQGASINAQTDETQETALTLACCGGFLEVADFLIKAGADLELGASTPLMEAAQEGHLELVRYLLGAGADVHAQTQTGDTALTYACENGHTDVADLLLRAGAHLEHESEGGRTPLMKACRAGHLCTVQFLVGKRADVNRMTANGDHTPLSLACAGGHADVVKFLLACDADPFRKLKDNSTTLIEAAKGGHTAVVQLLLDYPHSVMLPRGNGGGGVGGGGGGGVVVPADDGSGLSAAQAAALGLSHAPAPGAPQQRALLPAHPHPLHLPHAHPSTDPANFAKVYLEGRKKQAGGNNNAALCGAGVANVAGAAVVSATAVVTAAAPIPPPMAGIAPTPATFAAKHKCARKQRPAPAHPDHHLPPPPDILDEQRPDAVVTPQRNETSPETERNPLELTDVPGIPMLTSTLPALDLQFCAQGVTTIHTPTTPPYPPPQSLFPTQQLPTNLNQHQLQELHHQQLQQLAAQQQQQKKQQQQQQVLQQQQVMQQHLQQPYTQEVQQRQESYVRQTSEESGVGAGVEARELGAVLAYLQREVPSLVALPPNELRSLVLQVMQQKSLEGGGKCSPEPEGEAEERQARRLLAAAEEALAADYHQHHLDIDTTGSGCQYRVRAASPTGALEASTLVQQRLDDPDPEPQLQLQLQPQLPLQPQPQSTLPTQTDLQQQFALPYDDYRTAAFAPPHTPGIQPALHPPLALQPQLPQLQPQLPQLQPQPPAQPQLQPHSKRDHSHHHNNASVAVKKKGRFGGGGRGARCADGYGGAGAPAAAPAAYSAMDVDGETDSNHDTALTLACAGGHDELVELLLSRGADIEHRDKKGFTPLILAATAGHEKIVEILLNNRADIEAQSERTKDTPLSLACSGGRYEVVELLLSRGANKEHRNVSDYTPLSLAASGGYVNIIRLLLHHQAEINSRTGSKLGISPLMLAAMNGHTAAVRLLLDCGSDINAQIETNRNTALTLACFQGRHEVVSLLLDRKANVEHRAKTGLTPLMEAASGGYVEVGRVLLDKGADVNAPPVPSSRDTALTIAADKGHTKFVELLLQRRAAVEVKNKKGNSPLWLAANGGHLAVVEMLYAANADIDSQDNRKVSCLMAAYRKGHTKVVKWMVNVVTQFPSDQEMSRYICTISDKELLEKCKECVRVIRAAKETQAARANQNATILLEELDAERCREECRRQAAARRRERKKKKKMEKKEERRKLEAENEKNSLYCEKALGECSEGGEPDDEPVAKEEGDSGIDANSQGSCSSSDVKAPPIQSAKSKKKKKEEKTTSPSPAPPSKKQPDKNKPKIELKSEPEVLKQDRERKQEKENVAPSSPPATPVKPIAMPERRLIEKKEKKPEEDITKTITVQSVNKHGSNSRKSQVFESTRHNMEKDDVDATEKIKKTYNNHQWEVESKSTSPKGGCVGGRREEGWKEVVRKSSVCTLSCLTTAEPGCKKVSVGSHAISRVIGRAGSNINAIRSATGAHIEVDKQSKGQGERIITIKGSSEATKQAANLIAAMIRDPEADIAMLLPRTKLSTPQPQPLQPKVTKQPTPKAGSSTTSIVSSTARTPTVARPTTKQPPMTRPAVPRLSTHVPTPEKRASSTPVTPAPTPVKSAGLTYTGAIVGARLHTFAAKLIATPAGDGKPRPTAQVSAIQNAPLVNSAPPPAPSSPRSSHDSPPAPPLPRADDESRLQDNTLQLSPDSSSWSTNEESSGNPSALHINTTPQSSGSSEGGSGAQEYSLFNKLTVGASGGGMWGAGEPHHSVEPHPPQLADASKAPGYRGGGGGGGGCSPCSRTSSHGSTPPPYVAPAYHQPMPIGPPIPAPPQPPLTPSSMGNSVNTMDMSGLSRNGPMYQDNTRNGHNMMVSMSGAVSMAGATMGLGYMGVGSVGAVGSVGTVGNVGNVGSVGVENVSRLNPRAPDFAQRPPHMHPKHNTQIYTGANNAANLSTLMVSYPQQSPKPMHTQQPMHPYQSLLERGVGVGVGVGSVGWGGGEEEERKPRPIGIERARSKMAGDEWPHHAPHLAHMPDHDRYQGVSSMGQVGVEGAYGVGGGAAAAALSLMLAPPLQYLPPVPAAAPDAHHWDQQHHHQAPDKQTWSKWTH